MKTRTGVTKNNTTTRRTAPAESDPLPESGMLQMLVDSVKDYAIVMLDPKGNILTWSPTAERLTSWTSDEIVGQHFSKFYPPEEVRKGRIDHELKTAEKEGKSELEGWRLRKDGSRLWANVIITALHNPDESLRGFGLVLRDLTERKQIEEKVKKQAQEIMEMATVPVVPVWEGVMLVPLIGTLDSERTQHLMERLLQRIAESNSPVAVLDITGVPAIDTQTAQHLIEMISAVRLLGSDVVLTGVRPTIAQTLVHLGIDLSNVTTRSSLAAGLRVALRILDLAVVHQDSGDHSETKCNTVSRS